MKRTCFVLVSLLAITLLSCSALDNSAEDVNYPQANALNKAAVASASSYAAAALSSSSQKIVSGKTASVAAVKVGATACSNEIDFYFGNPPAAATITKLEVGGGTVGTNVGLFQMNYLKVRCGASTNNSTTMAWAGATPISASTTYFNGQAAKTTCYLSFCGTCTSGYYVGTTYVPQCNKSYTNISMTIYYEW